MTDLVACVSDNEKTKAHVQSLVEKGEWNKIFLIGSSSLKDNFNSQKRIDFISIESQKPVFELIKDIHFQLSGKLNDIEVALNIVSGTGKEHMAVLSALLKLGVGVRLLAVTKEGVKEL